MTYIPIGSTGAEAAAAHAAAVARAVKASGGIVELTSEEFIKLVNRAEKPLVVTAVSGMFTKTNRYITNYRGMFLYTKSKQPLQLPTEAELIIAEKIWVP